MAGSSLGVRKGAWTEEEDNLLRKCIQKYGEKDWHKIPPRAGLNRCRKSCRLRWLDHLKPDIKKGEFEADEVDLIIRLHKLLGNRWSLIAGRLPGRTGNGVKNYWNTYLRKQQASCEEYYAKERSQNTQNVSIIRPRPRRFSKNLSRLEGKTATTENRVMLKENISRALDPETDDTVWWERLLAGMESDEVACSSIVGSPERSYPGTTKVEDTNFGEDGRSYFCDLTFDMNLWNLFNSQE